VGTDSGLTLTGNVLTGSGAGGRFTTADLAALADGALTIKPPLNANDDFELTIIAVSTDGGSSEATMPVSVAAVNDAPDVEAPIGLAMNEDGTLTITAAALLAKASDVDHDALSVVNLTATGGTLTDNGDGTWTFTPAEDFNGTINLSYGFGCTLTSGARRSRCGGTPPRNRAPISLAMNEDGTLTYGGGASAKPRTLTRHAERCRLTRPAAR